jgi:hypothetical protein
MILADKVDLSLLGRRSKMLLEIFVIDTSIWSVNEVMPEMHDLER